MATLEIPAGPDDRMEKDELAATVVIPTYCSDSGGLDRVMTSLDSQSLPHEQFEALFVDDGSPDDTVERLLALAETRPYMRVTTIPNSGWPSRPRNVGVRMARGEYVVFMDHDDILFPNALEDATRFARAHGLDALSAKEVKTSSRFFTWRAFQRDISAPDHKEPVLLSPMTPHKMYRRRHLLEHGIVFPEGKLGEGKVQWEDIHFNIDVYASTARLGVLASRPFYHWVVGHGSNSSSSFTRDPNEYWQHLVEIFVHLDESGMDQQSADWIRASNYSNRVLQGMVGPGGLKRDPAYYARALELAEEFVARYVPRRIDALLDPLRKPRSTLLRKGRADLLRLLAEHDQGVRAVPVATAVRMLGSELRVTCEALWTAESGAPLGLHCDGDRLLRVVPDEVAAVVGKQDLDVTQALDEACVDFAITARDSRLAWPVPTDGETRIVEEEGRVLVRVDATGVVDPRTGALGHRVDDGLWEVALRSTFAGFASSPQVQYAGPPVAALVEGRLVTAFSSPKQRLLLDVGGRRRTLLTATRPDLEAAAVRRSGLAHRLLVPLLDVEVSGVTRLAVRVLLRSEEREKMTFAGEVIGDSSGARLEAVLVGVPQGRHRVLVDDTPAAGARGGMRVTPFVLDVGRGGRAARMRLSREAVRKPKRPVWGMP